MNWFFPIARKLYLRIWLAVAASVLVLSLLAGWAWLAAEQRGEQERERLAAAPRQVVVSNAQGDVLGTAEALMHRVPDRGIEFDVILSDGQVLNLHLPLSPRARGPGGGPSGAGGGRGGPPWRDESLLPAWLRPPYGFIWTLALTGLGVMVALFPVARRLTRRLVALQHGVQRWGEGDLSVRVPTGGSDEVADLARHFNTAAGHIQTLMNAQATLLQSQKSLLANASHEL
ncbi:MAG: HAMP domain-containing protein, partial [Burkholderiaceae bacterium]|nr:HAMP domain-containing protein [Burkholderiaceae bacterium]